MFKNLSRIDQIILSVAGSLLLLFSYFLYDDRLLFEPLTGTKSSSIGQIYHLENDVRHKGLDSFSWYPATKAETLYQQDSIFTGENSQASLQLEDGSLIHIRENSLITLNLKQGQFQLDLKYGDLISEVKENQNIQIKSGTEEYEVKGSSKESTSVVIKKNRLGQSEVQSLRGAPKVISKKSGKALTLKQAPPKTFEKFFVKGPQSPFLNPSEKPIVQNSQDPKPNIPTPPAAKIEAKTPDQLVVKRKLASDTFWLEWKSEGEFENYQLEIKSSLDNNQILQTETLKENKLLLGPKLDDGSYTWTVKTVAKDGKTLTESKPHQFHLWTLQSPFWLKPDLGQKIPGDDLEVSLEWSGTKAEFFEWQLSKTIDFSKPSHQGQSKTPEDKVKQLESGIYFARVRAKKWKDIWSDWSSPGKFVVLPKVPAVLKAPILAQTKFNYDPSQLALRNIASIPATKIAWQNVPQAKSYIVEVASEPDFSDSKKIPETKVQFNFSDYSKAKHYVRVFALGEQGQRSPSSKVAEISILLQKPRMFPVENVIEKNSDPTAKAPDKMVNFQWTPIMMSSIYQVEVATADDFKNAQVLDSKETKSPWKVSAPGDYYARVRPLDSRGLAMTEASDPIKFSYTFEKALAPPVLAEPFNETTVFLQQAMEPFIWLEWKTDAEAEGYEVQISNDPSFKRVVLQGRSENHRFLVKEKIPYGKIFWRVRSLGKKTSQNSNWSMARNFSLIHKKNEALIE